MAPFPLPLTGLLGKWGAYAIFLLIGFSFVFFPTDSFIDDTVETPFYIVPRAGE